MPIQITCTSCGTELNLPDSAAGKCQKCKCGNVIVIPISAAAPVDSAHNATPAAPMTKTCPFCRETIKTEARKCRYCGEFLDQSKSNAPPPINLTESIGIASRRLQTVGRTLRDEAKAFADGIAGSKPATVSMGSPTLWAKVAGWWSGQSTKQRRWIFVGAGGLSVLIIAITIAGSLVDFAIATSTTQNVVNIDKYNQLETGMSYSQVVGVIGEDGSEIASTEIDGVPILTKAYSWKNRDGSNMMAMFQNDKLISKSQGGLK